ncbi:MAG: transposase [Nitrospirae bacterium]|nr:transposase [Nitrospirota bacterium]
MTYNPDIHKRHSLRLKGFDYAQTGAYFITICTQNRECLFGKVVNDQRHLNDAGEMILTSWNELPRHYPGVDVDQFVVMPNHVHGIIILTVGAGPRACPELHIKKRQPEEISPALSLLSLSDIIQRFKSLTTTHYLQGVIQTGWPPFHKKLWQRNYYEHVIRNEESLNRIRQYIHDNPLNWNIDEENPEGQARGPAPT